MSPSEVTPGLSRQPTPTIRIEATRIVGPHSIRSEDGELRGVLPAGRGGAIRVDPRGCGTFDGRLNRLVITDAHLRSKPSAFAPDRVISALNADLPVQFPAAVREDRRKQQPPCTFARAEPPDPSSMIHNSSGRSRSRFPLSKRARRLTGGGRSGRRQGSSPGTGTRSAVRPRKSATRHSSHPFLCTAPQPGKAWNASQNRAAHELLRRTSLNPTPRGLQSWVSSGVGPSILLRRPRRRRLSQRS